MNHFCVKSIHKNELYIQQHWAKPSFNSTSKFKSVCNIENAICNHLIWWSPALMLYSVMYSDEKRINNALPPLVLSCRALWVPSIPGFQKPLALFLLRDRRRSPEPQWESSSCYNQKWHNVNKYTDYSAHLFCAMQLTSFIIPKTLQTPNTHSLSFVWIGVIEWLMWMACSGETSFWGEWLISPMYSCCSR